MFILTFITFYTIFLQGFCPYPLNKENQLKLKHFGIWSIRLICCKYNQNMPNKKKDVQINEHPCDHDWVRTSDLHVVDVAL